MALPVALTSGNFPPDNVGTLGPFISSGGNVYTIVVGATTSQIAAYKATDPTTSFAVQDSSNNPITDSGAVGALSVVQDSDLLHCVYQDANGTVSYAQFNMATDAWISTGFGFSGGNTEVVLNNPADNPTLGAGVDIVIRSDGDIVAAYCGENPITMGGTYQEIAYSRWEGSSWTNGVVVASSGTKSASYLRPQATIRTDDIIDIWYNGNFTVPSQSVNMYLYGAPISAANALWTPDDVTNDNEELIHWMAAYADRANDAVTLYTNQNSTQYSGEEYIEFHSPPTFSGDTYSGVASSGFITPDGVTDPLIQGLKVDDDAGKTTFFPDVPTARTSIRLYTNASSSTVTQESADITSGTPTSVDGMSANIITRANNVIYGFIYDDAGTLRYDEYVIRALGISGSGGLTTGAFSLGGTGDVTTPATRVDVSWAEFTYLANDNAANLVMPKAALQGTGSRGVIGSGNLQPFAVAIEAMGERVIPSSGALTVPASVLAGTGAIKITGTGALALSQIVLASAGERTITGVAALLLASTALSGTGVRTANATGNLTVPATVLASTGERIISGSGNLTLPASVLAATGERTIPASGALAVPAASLAATGEFFIAITGEGALLLSSTALSGSGVRTANAAGSLTVPASILAATGERIIPASGNLTVPQAVLAATGERTIEGSGTVIPTLTALILDEATDAISLTSDIPCTIYWARHVDGTVIDDSDAADIIAGTGTGFTEGGSFAVTEGSNSPAPVFAVGNDGVQEFSVVGQTADGLISNVLTSGIDILTGGLPAGAVHHYDLSNDTTLTKSGSNITAVSDLGSAGAALGEPGANYPTWDTATIGGLQAADFSGNKVLHHALLDTALQSGTATYTAAIVFDPRSVGSFSDIFGFVKGAELNYVAFSFDNNPLEYLIRRRNGLTTDAIATVGPATNTDTLAIVVARGDDYDLYIDGVKVMDNVTNTRSAGPYTVLALGARYIGAGGSTWLNGHIGEAVFYGSELTGTDLTDLQSSLAAKWGITLP